jgi:hypothetical protein
VFDSDKKDFIHLGVFLVDSQRLKANYRERFVF